MPRREAPKAAKPPLRRKGVCQVGRRAPAEARQTTRMEGGNGTIGQDRWEGSSDRAIGDKPAIAGLSRELAWVHRISGVGLAYRSVPLTVSAKEQPPQEREAADCGDGGPKVRVRFSCWSSLKRRHKLARREIALRLVAVNASRGEVVHMVRPSPGDRDAVIDLPCAAVPVAAVVRPCKLLFAVSAFPVCLLEYRRELFVAKPQGALPPFAASAAAPRMRPPKTAAAASPATTCFR